MPIRKFPKEGFYTGDGRTYYISGTTKGNMWFDIEDTDKEWWKLMWTCVPTIKRIQERKYVFSKDNPTNIPIK